MLWDITPEITESIPVWPGSYPTQRTVELDISKGDVVTSSTLHATVHLGAHADAPLHYSIDGRSIDMQPLHYYLGPCQVIQVSIGKGGIIQESDIQKQILCPRILFKTKTFSYKGPFREDFAAIHPDLMENLATKFHVHTVGIDTPSVDPFDSHLLSHKAALKYDMALLENLALDHVPEGIYELIALPLKLKGFDASPVRAILRTCNDMSKK